MKLLLTILILFCLNVSAQTYVKVADRAEYAKYEKWGKDSIWVDIVQYGKATVVNPKVLGLDYQLYKAINGNYTSSLLKDTVWYRLWHRGLKTTAISLTSDQVLITKKVRIKTQRCETTPAHYYLERDKLRSQW